MDNKTILQGFEWYIREDGKHWQNMSKQAKELADNGINMVWLPPAYKGAGGASSVGYDVYDTYDLGEFDQKGSIKTKYGSRREYLDCVNKLQSAGIEVLSDIVLNHMMGADECQEVMAAKDESCDRNHQVSEPYMIEAWTKFSFPGRAGKYSTDTWSWENYSGTDWDQRAQENGIYSFEGKTWNGNTDIENGNYDYLMGADLDMSYPDTIDKLYKWTKWYYDTVGMDGFRLDAVKHISADFYRDWLKMIREYTKSDMFTVGEYWVNDIGRLESYLDMVEGQMSLFDVPLHFNFQSAATSDGNYDMGSIFNNTLVARRPMNAVTFVDNHDTQPGQALVSWIPEWFKPLAYAIILLQEGGLPCVFYGDYYGIEHDNIKPVWCIKLLCQARIKSAYGSQNSYFDDCDVVGFTRAGHKEHKNSGLAVLLTDHLAGSKYMIVNPELAGKTMSNILDADAESVVLDQDGGATFSVADGSLGVWTLQ